MAYTVYMPTAVVSYYGFYSRSKDISNITTGQLHDTLHSYCNTIQRCHLQGNKLDFTSKIIELHTTYVSLVGQDITKRERSVTVQHKHHTTISNFFRITSSFKRYYSPFDKIEFYKLNLLSRYFFKTLHQHTQQGLFLLTRHYIPFLLNSLTMLSM